MISDMMGVRPAGTLDRFYPKLHLPLGLLRGLADTPESPSHPCTGVPQANTAFVLLSLLTPDTSYVRLRRDLAGAVPL